MIKEMKNICSYGLPECLTSSGQGVLRNFFVSKIRRGRRTLISGTVFAISIREREREREALRNIEI